MQFVQITCHFQGLFFATVNQMAMKLSLTRLALLVHGVNFSNVHIKFNKLFSFHSYYLHMLNPGAKNSCYQFSKLISDANTFSIFYPAGNYADEMWNFQRKSSGSFSKHGVKTLYWQTVWCQCRYRKMISKQLQMWILIPRRMVL